MMLLSFIGLSAINSDAAATIIQKAADSRIAIMITKISFTILYNYVCYANYVLS